MFGAKHTVHYCVQISINKYPTHTHAHQFQPHPPFKTPLSSHTQGRVVFNGPRVRMGVHWASSDTFIIAEHPETELKVFKGRGWELAHEVGDMGWGGQVLLTEHAWQACQHNMSLAGFPIVQQLGLFKLKHWMQTMWLYEVWGGCDVGWGGRVVCDMWGVWGGVMFSRQDTYKHGSCTIPRKHQHPHAHTPTPSCTHPDTLMHTHQRPPLGA